MKKLYFLLVIIFAGSLFMQAQNLPTTNQSQFAVWIDMMQDPNANFFATQRAFEKYWEGQPRTKGDGWKVFKRWEAFMQTRVNIDGMKPAPDAVMQQYEQMLSSGMFASNSGTWTNVGPTLLPANGTGQPNGLGRVNVVAFHPTNANIIWVGAPAGGLWKTYNGGATWTNLTDNLPTLGVSSIVIDTNNVNIMYMGTGDRDAGDAPGLGVYKSLDGGATWTASNSGMGNVTVGEILIQPNLHTTLVAATSSGIYKSTNSGSTWTLRSSAGNFKDIDYQPGSSTIMYATKASSSGAAFYRSMDGGNTWSQISTGLTNTGDRMVIGTTPANYNYIYLVAGSSTGLDGIYLSTNGGNSFSTKATSPNLLGYSETGNDTKSQAYYDLAVVVDPNNANTLYVGGINIWKSVNAGTSWSINAHWVGSGGVPEVHADQHWLGFSPVDGQLYNGNDGGIYRTSNGGTSWVDITSGLGISQIYKIGQSATVQNSVIAGFQDNGTALLSGSAWSTEIGGDGMECIVDPTTNNYMYGALYYGDIRRSTDGGTTFYTIADDGTNGINESGAWVTPYCLQENQPGTMFIGYKNVWRSTNVKASSSSSVSWTAISSFGSSSSLNCIENSMANNAILYVSRGSSLFRTDNANASSPTWTTLSGPGSTITYLETHPTNSNIVYATAGYNVYKSVNKGQSWTSISGNLPSVSINCVVYDTTSNEGLYVGTDLGVYYRDASMTNWIVFSSGIPMAAEVTELEIYYNANPAMSRIRAATYGRGVWSSDLYLNPNAIPNADFVASSTTACAGETIGLYDATSGSPISWRWSVTPSTHSFVGGTSNTSQNPSVKLTSAGNYTIKLVATNSNGSDSITKVNYISVGVPNSLPFSENFETFTAGDPGTWDNGWTYTNSGVFNWRANSGPTTSGTTGPDADHTYGNANGMYLYTEATSPAVLNEVTNLISPCIALPTSGNISLSFFYHMFGADITALHVDIFYNGIWINDIHTITGQQQTSNAASWANATVALSSYMGTTVKFRFRVIRGANYSCDIAIDDIFVGVAGIPIADFSASATNTYAGGTLNFYDMSTQSPTSYKWIFSPSTVSYVGGTNQTSQNPSVKFTNAGTYSVTLIATNSVGSDTITKTNYITVVSALTIPNLETFESFTTGSPGTFQNNWSTAGTGNFPWYVNAGPTTSSLTGPSVDHTIGNSVGKYVYTEATGTITTGSEAILVSPAYNLTTVANAELSFWYHMYGGSIDALRIDVLYNGSWIENVYVITGQQQTSNAAAWAKASVSLSAYVGSSIKIRFRVIHPNSYTSDVAIDDVKVAPIIPPINDEPCGAIALNVNTTCNYYTGTTLNATSTTGVTPPGCGGSTVGSDVWFKAIVPSSGALNIAANQVTGSFADGVMAAYKGSCTSLTLLNCVDDFNGTGNMPYISLTNQTPGDTIFLRFWFYYSNQNGDFDICITSPPTFTISPDNQNVAYQYGTAKIYVNTASTVSWSVSDNATWLTLSPASGTGSDSVTATFSANTAGLRTATITGVATGFPNKIVTITQESYVNADFTLANQFVCTNSSITFANTSTNATSNTWYINGSQTATTSNLTHTFTATGNYSIKLIVSGLGFTDSITKRVFVGSIAQPNAGVDTTICEGDNISMNPGVNTGILACTSSCAIPTYCPSASNNDNLEYITKVQIGSVSQSSTNMGVGYEDFSASVFMPVMKDSTYSLSISAFTNASYTEFVDVFIDWDRNGLFDEPAISLGSTAFVGAHTFSGFFSVPSTAALGKTKMRVIMKYNVAIISGCETGYGFGETEDYMLDIMEYGILPHTWTGVSSFSSSQVNPSITSIATNQSGAYNLSVTNAYGCVGNDSKNITVNALPVVSFASIPNICANSPSILLNQALPTGGVYSGSGVLNGRFYPNIAGVGTHTISYTASNGNCVGTATQTVTVTAIPNASFTGLPTSICISAANVQLSGSPAGGVFTGQGIQQSQFSPSIAGHGSHVISYIVSNAQGCSDTASNSVLVYALPIANAGADTTINYGTAANLMASATGLIGSASYAWTPAASVVNANSASTATTNLNQSTTFTVTVVDNITTCANTDQMLVDIAGGPLAMYVSAWQTVICQNDTATISSIKSGGVGTVSYSWVSNPAGFTSTQSTINVTPTVNTWYIATASDNNSSVSDSILITVNPLPMVDFSMPSAVCEDVDSVILIPGQNSIGGTFSGTTVVGNVFFPSIAGSGNHSIHYTFTNGSGCTNVKTKIIAVNPKPIVNMGSFGPLCNTSSAVSLTSGTPYGGTYSGVGVTGTQFSPAVAGIGSHWVSYRFTNQNGCSDSDSTLVVVNSSPVANAGSNQTIATGNAATLSGSANGGSGSYIYLWSPANQLVNNAIQNPTTQVLSASQLFGLKVVDSQTQCSDSDQVLVTVSGGQLVVALQMASTSICEGDSNQLNAIGSGGSGNYTYSWTSSPAGFTSSLQNPKVAPTATTAYLVTLNDGTNSASDGKFVIVEVNPISSLPTDTGVCANGQISLDAGGGYASYQWSTGANSQIVTIDGSQLPFGYTNFYVTITNTNGCNVDDSIRVNVPFQNASFLGPDSTFCVQNPLVLDAGAGKQSYLWSNGATTQINNFGFMPVGPFTVWAQTVDQYNCTSTDTINLFGIVCLSIATNDADNRVTVYPNPAQEKVNIAVEGEKADEAVLRIYDMQGKLVYESKHSLKAGNNTIEVDVNSYSPGIYNIQLKGKYLYSTHKLIVQ